MMKKEITKLQQMMMNSMYLWQKMEEEIKPKIINILDSLNKT